MRITAWKFWDPIARLFSTGSESTRRSPRLLLDRLRRSLLGTSPSSSLCVEITDTAIKFATARRINGRYSLRDVRGFSRSGKSEEDLRRSLSDLLESVPADDARVVLILGRADVLARRRTFPTADPREIAAMVPFQAATLLPLPPDEFIIRHRVLAIRADGHSDVAIVAVPARTIEERVRILGSCGLSVSTVRLAVELIDQDVSSRLLAEGESEPALLVDVDGDSIGVVALGDGAASLSRTFRFDADAVGPLALEASRDLERVSGRRFHLAVVSERAQAVTSIVEVLSGDGLRSRRLPSMRDAGLRLDGPEEYSYLGVTSGAQQPFAEGLDFLPSGLRADLEVGARRSRFLRIAALCLYCLAILTGLVEHQIRSKQGILDGAYTYLRATEVAARRLEEMRAMDLRLGSQTDGVSTLERFREMCLACPSGVRLSEVTIDCREATYVRGTATSTEHALDFVDTLDRSPLFQSATLQFIGSSDRSSGVDAEFEIRCEH